MKNIKEVVANEHKISNDKKKLEDFLKTRQMFGKAETQHKRCGSVNNLFSINMDEKKKNLCKKKADFEEKLEKIAKIKQRKKIEKFSKIKQKVKQIKSRYKRSRTDPVRNTFAINSLGALIVTSTIIYIYIAGILSLFFSEANFYFMREMMRILECISISIVSYFFGGIFSKTEKIFDEDE